jgi:hypothetical protein
MYTENKYTPVYKVLPSFRSIKKKAKPNDISLLIFLPVQTNVSFHQIANKPHVPFPRGFLPDFFPRMQHPLSLKGDIDSIRTDLISRWFFHIFFSTESTEPYRTGKRQIATHRQGRLSDTTQLTAITNTVISPRVTALSSSVVLDC